MTVSAPTGGTSVMVKLILVLPRPSPAMLAWSEATSRKDSGRTVVRLPTMGTETSTSSVVGVADAVLEGDGLDAAGDVLDGVLDLEVAGGADEVGGLDALPSRV